jgi:hypothetical protein
MNNVWSLLMSPILPHDVFSNDVSWSQMYPVSAKNHPVTRAVKGSCFFFYSCLRNIVGARFHCAICESVEICSSCESAGLPGNIDSAEGGHSSSHIMIKVCGFLASKDAVSRELQRSRTLLIFQRSKLLVGVQYFCGQAEIRCMHCGGSHDQGPAR